MTDVKASPVQTIIQGTMTLPPHAVVPRQMKVSDDQGHLIGMPIARQVNMKSSNGSKTVHMMLTTGAVSTGANALIITPMNDYTSPSVRLDGRFPAKMTVLPSLEATIKSVAFQSNKTVVQVSMDQAKYTRMTTYQGENIAGQFWLIADNHYVGSQAVTFDSRASNNAEIVFGKVNRNQPWIIEAQLMQPQTALELTVPLK